MTILLVQTTYDFLYYFSNRCFLPVLLRFQEDYTCYMFCAVTRRKLIQNLLLLKSPSVIRAILTRLSLRISEKTFEAPKRSVKKTLS